MTDASTQGARPALDIDSELELPARYEAVARLGKGGGGEVWSIRDRLTGEVLALKTLSLAADERETEALVREAVALSGLEGLGVPRALRFGRLPRSKRPYLIRQLVEGNSLAAWLTDKPAGFEQAVLSAVARVAEQLTALHRAGLLHGDVKPANIIVGPKGDATLVDLGLVAAFREKGEAPVGLTLLYAAPELLAGGPITVRAEVFALGATLRDVVEAIKHSTPADKVSRYNEIVARAVSPRPEARYPSVDELKSALGLAAGLDEPKPSEAVVWPVVGLDEPARVLVAHMDAMAAGSGVVLTGPEGSGRTTLLRRVAWALGIAGRSVAWLEVGQLSDQLRAIEVECSGDAVGSIIIVDDAQLLSSAAADRIAELRQRGAKLLMVANAETPLLGPTLEVFSMTRLGEAAARDLVSRNIPSLDAAVVDHVLKRAGRWPGKLRAIVEQLRGAPVVAPEDVDQLVPEIGPTTMSSRADSTRPSKDVEPVALDRIRATLEKGHFEEAAELFQTRGRETSVEGKVLLARLSSNQGKWKAALDLLASVGDADAAGETVAAEHCLELARAHLRAGDNASSARDASAGLAKFGSMSQEAPRRVVVAVTELWAIGGLAKSFLGEHDRAQEWLERATLLARSLGDARTLSIALGSLAFALQRTGKLEEAQAAYEEALESAQTAGDAGTVATTRLNLATVAKARGDLAKALLHLEAAVDMGRRAGRVATLRQALLNLANLDLYLGRLSRAHVSIEHLSLERDQLPPQMRAQLLALEAELAMKSGDPARAESLCAACGDAYMTLGRPVDAAEAIIEGALAALARASSSPSRDLVVDIEGRVSEAERLLGESDAHRAALLLVKARLRTRSDDTVAATALFDQAIEAAKASGKRDWLARAYQARAALLFDEGQRLFARRDREAALGVLEEIALKLPRDLREVFWDDPLRRSLRDVETSMHVPVQAAQAAAPGLSQDRLARVLEINREIAGTYDLRRLLDRVTDHAIALLSAERGFVILKSARVGAPEGDLSIHASRDQAGDDPHARFSQSIADRVIKSGEPIVTASARDDSRMQDYVSVHQLMLQSVACVPIRSRSSGTIGALYLETRHRSLQSFSEELPLLVALADQVAIAIDTATLVSENERRAVELQHANAELKQAQARLEELLGHRTAQLHQTRRDLKNTRAVLKSHFGYEGLVGTSESMRKVYALVDRIKETDVPVLIIGESGTGKEVVARAIHNASPRAKKPFLGLNCGAIPEHLLESELFGHVRGAFTGADRDRKGLFMEATDGTLLLDEIGEMPQKMQAGLLRVLQEKVVRPVGGSREESVNTRVIAATHRDLGTMVERGQFREDLFYRLNVIQLRVPPLRERIDDIPMLIDHFLGIFAARYSRDRRSVSRAALKMLIAHRWPGNVRQLENALLNAWVLSDGPELEVEDFELSDPSGSLMRSAGGAVSVAPGSAPSSSDAVSTSLDAHKKGERERILQALSASNWNRVKAAELIGMPRRTFYRRLKDYGIQ